MWQADGCTAEREKATLDLYLREPCIGCGNANICCEHQFNADGKTYALHCGDDRFCEARAMQAKWVDCTIWIVKTTQG